MKNLILGTVNNYNFYQLARFAYSLERSGFEGETCLFTGESIGSSTLKALQKLNIKTIGFDSDPKAISALALENGFSIPDPVVVNNYRYIFYFDHLKKHGAEYEYVMLTDVRDVVFQRDPFDFEIADSLYCALEPKKIGDCSVNSEWIKIAFGEDVLEGLKQSDVFCSGTTWGRTPEVLTYLEKMLAELERLPHASGTIIDQAIHNYLIHTRRLGPVKPLSNDKGVVMTLHHESRLTFNERDEVIDPTGKVVNVLHQYERHLEVITRIDKRLFKNVLAKGLEKAYYKAQQLIGR